MIEKFTAFVVDDEFDARISIKTLCEKSFPELHFVGEANSVKTAIPSLLELQPQILFLDIKLGDGTGFDILEQIGKVDCQVLFTTAYDEYAIKAIKARATDYLLKPISIKDLKSAVQLAIETINDKHELTELRNTINQYKVEKVGLPARDRIELTTITDIIRLQAESNYTYVYLKNGSKILVAKTLKNFETLLKDKHFLRVHQSHIVNIDSIASFDQKANQFLLHTNEQIPVSRRYKALLNKLFSMKVI